MPVPWSDHESLDLIIHDFILNYLYTSIIMTWLDYFDWTNRDIRSWHLINLDCTSWILSLLIFSLHLIYEPNEGTSILSFQIWFDLIVKLWTIYVLIKFWSNKIRWSDQSKPLNMVFVFFLIIELDLVQGSLTPDNPILWYDLWTKNFEKIFLEL